MPQRNPDRRQALRALRTTRAPGPGGLETQLLIILGWMLVRPLILFLVVFLSSNSQTLAQQSPVSSSSKNAKPDQHVKRSVSTPESETGENIYRNAMFGFTYRTVLGWVDRTKEMQAGDTDASKGKVLLAAFERPPDAPGDSVNSAVVIAQESAASYPGLKTAVDYVGPLTELVTSKGFQSAGEPYEFQLGPRTLVRCDFVRELGKLTMRQSTLVLLQKGSIVSFTFLAGNAEEVERLIERLNFGSRAAQK